MDIQTTRQVKNLLTKLLAEQQEPVIKTMTGAVEAFLNAKQSLARNTLLSYKNCLHIFCDYSTAWPVMPEQIESYFVHLYKVRGCTDGGVHGHYRVLKCWLNWLVDRGLIFDNPISKVTPPARPNPLPRAPKESDLHKLFEAVKNHKGRDYWVPIRDMAVFTLLLDSGLRINELLSLEFDDLDREQMTALIRQTKTKQQRIVAFSPAAKIHLDTWLQVRSKLDIPDNLRRVFVARYRQTYWRKLDAQGIRRMREIYCKSAGIPIFRLHDLRHAAAIFFLRSGGDLLDIQKQLGHTSLLTTERYLQVTDTGRPARYVKNSPLKYLEGKS